MKQRNRIENGHPISISGLFGEISIDNKLLADNLTGEEQQMVLNWIKANIKPRKTPMYRATSYGIKHILEDDLHLHLTNNQFKDAMLMCGFKPVDESELNWFYCISTRSPIFIYKLPFEKKPISWKQYFAESEANQGKSDDEIFIEKAIKQGVSTEKTAKEFIEKFCNIAWGWHNSYADSKYMHLYRYSRAKGDNLPDLH